MDCKSLANIPLEAFSWRKKNSRIPDPDFLDKILPGNNESENAYAAAINPDEFVKKGRSIKSDSKSFELVDKLNDEMLQNVTSWNKNPRRGHAYAESQVAHYSGAVKDLCSASINLDYMSSLPGFRGILTPDDVDLIDKYRRLKSNEEREEFFDTHGAHMCDEYFKLKAELKPQGPHTGIPTGTALFLNHLVVYCHFDNAQPYRNPDGKDYWDRTLLLSTSQTHTADGVVTHSITQIGDDIINLVTVGSGKANCSFLDWANGFLSTFFWSTTKDLFVARREFTAQNPDLEEDGEQFRKKFEDHLIENHTILAVKLINLRLIISAGSAFGVPFRNFIGSFIATAPTEKGYVLQHEAQFGPDNKFDQEATLHPFLNPEGLLPHVDPKLVVQGILIAGHRTLISGMLDFARLERESLFKEHPDMENIITKKIYEAFAKLWTQDVAPKTIERAREGTKYQIDKLMKLEPNRTKVGVEAIGISSAVRGSIVEWLTDLFEEQLPSTTKEIQKDIKGATDKDVGYERLNEICWGIYQQLCVETLLVPGGLYDSVVKFSYQLVMKEDCEREHSDILKRINAFEEARAALQREADKFQEDRIMMNEEEIKEKSEELKEKMDGIETKKSEASKSLTDVEKRKEMHEEKMEDHEKKTAEEMKKLSKIERI
ncbi:hypothetical protein N7540_004409 [Penicillium herquei]|nr:hypothetical protein N7540_004409 [Penicillium herquei]